MPTIRPREQAFREIVHERMDALFVNADGFPLTHIEQIATLASWTAVPAAYGYCEAVMRGGLTLLARADEVIE